MQSRPTNQKGFTLVELLIVIALLGVLAAAVLAAINPLEQANRARDARMKSDASQLLAAIDRYYVAIGHFPWYNVGGLADEDELDFVNAKSQAVGICGADCTQNGVLITNNELKTEFKSRDFLKTATTAAVDMLYVAKADSTAGGGIAESVYACWVPKSKSERQKATRQAGAGGTITTVAAGVCSGATMTYTDLTNSCLVCLPE